MHIDPSQTSVSALYHWMVGLITPRPIAWVSTRSQEGHRNLAPYSFFNGVGAKPPTLMFCPANRDDGTPKDTLENIRQTGQFVINVVTESVLQAMNLTAKTVQPDVDEFELAELQAAACRQVDVPRVAAAEAHFECELMQSIQLGTGPGGANLVIGRIVWIEVDDRLIRDSGRLDETKLGTIGRMGGAGYVRTADRIELPRP